MTITPLDWAIVVLYFVANTGICIWCALQKEKTTADYFLASRSAGWFLIGSSIFASNIGAEHLIGLAGSGAGSPAVGAECPAVGATSPAPTGSSPASGSSATSRWRAPRGDSLLSMSTPRWAAKGGPISPGSAETNFSTAARGQGLWQRARVMCGR